jgi:hypothetical protein
MGVGWWIEHRTADDLRYPRKTDLEHFKFRGKVINDLGEAMKQEGYRWKFTADGIRLDREIDSPKESR